jgi:hypothetical protein
VRDVGDKRKSGCLYKKYSVSDGSNERIEKKNMKGNLDFFQLLQKCRANARQNDITHCVPRVEIEEKWNEPL